MPGRHQGLQGHQALCCVSKVFAMFALRVLRGQAADGAHAMAEAAEEPPSKRPRSDCKSASEPS
eukprot:2948347-Alexandrium_andersonii.AAC.1